MRSPRFKSSKFKYHIRVRGFKEFPLFRDKGDKRQYLHILKKYKKVFSYRIYSYCIMTTHAHFFIDPRGSDISEIMHRVNLSYAKYYNNKYNRSGPVFRDRFGSDPVCSNQYSLALSIYIHNNPKDVRGYRGREEYFYFSSYGIYARLRSDEFNLVETEYVLNLMLCKDIEEARRRYLALCRKQSIDNSVKNIIKALMKGEMRISANTEI